MHIAHQQREAEVVEQAFDGAFPLALFVAHLQQFSGEQDIVFADTGGAAQFTAHFQNLPRNVRTAAVQGLQLRLQLVVLLLQLAQFHAGFGQRVLGVGLCRLAFDPPFANGALIGGERIGAGGARELERFGACVVLHRPTRPFLFLDSLVGDIALDPLDPVAALLGDRLTYGVAIGQLTAARFRGHCDPLGQLLDLVVQVGDAFLQKIALPARKPRAKRLAAGAKKVHLRRQAAAFVARGHQRRQESHLFLRLQYQLVRAVEILIMPDQGLNPLFDRRGLQHMLAHEIGEVAHRLHRDGLVEEIHRLFVLDAEAVTVRRAVWREGLEEFHLRPGAQALAQRVDVGAEAGEVLLDGERLIRDDEQTGRRALRRLCPEDLSQSDVLRQRLVEEAAEQHRIAVGAAQGYGLRRETGFAALTLVAPEKIGFQAAFAGSRAGRLIEVGARHQERRDGVDERRFSGADVSREERVVAAQIQTPNLFVKRAPIEHLHAVQAESRAAGNCGGRLQFREQRFTPIHETPLPQCGPCNRPGGDRTRPATAHRQTT